MRSLFTPSGRSPRMKGGSSLRKLFVVLVAGLVALPGPSISNEAKLRLPKGSLVGAMFTHGQTEVTYYDIFLIGTGGRPHVNLTRAGFRQNGPSWSPDGRSIAYTARSGLFVMDADGGRKRLVRPVRFFDDGSWIERYWTTWSPDGTRIATTEWLATEEGYTSTSLVSYRPDGTGRKVLYATEHHVWAPDWSPDGSTVAFTQCRYEQVGGGALRDRECDVLTVAHDGTGKPSSLPTHPQAADMFPRWGPEGQLYFHSWRDCFDASPESQCSGIYELAAGATEAEMILPDEDWNGDGNEERLWFIIPPFRGTTFVVPLALGWDPTPIESGLEPTKTELWAWDRETGARRRISKADTGPYLDWRYPCTVRGTKGDDTLRGTPRSDLICALGGSDRITGMGGDDVIFGHAGVDVIDGGAGADIVVGNEGRDRCVRDEKDHSHVC